jgi:Ca-activated chloride channel homolog
MTIFLSRLTTRALAALAVSLPLLVADTGTLQSSRGACPLRHTDVQAEVTGTLARVTVTQIFENTFNEKIEAVYTFPLPHEAAVDSMLMKIGDRTIRGDIKRREEARAIYEAARNSGRTASLLDQQRPNIFTQSVANIPPREQVHITISYVETLPYEEGEYVFAFPMVVGPRYIPGTPTGRQGGGWSPDTDRVPDASHITPPVAKPGTRAGHDISVAVSIDAGLALDRVRSVTHEIELERPSSTRARVRLKQSAVLPNKDFVLRYDIAGRAVGDAVLAHSDSRGGFFSLILQPPERVTAAEVTPKELVFVLDTSGSMSGFPIEKAKETMRLALDALYPQDTFNLITFAGDTHILFPSPLPATAANLRRAQEFLAGRSGGGGTEMMKAIRAALEGTENQGHIRIVCFMTDGYVGNDDEIIAEVARHPNARVFSFGIGSSVNRYLLNKMAALGRGEVEYVGLGDDGSAAARRFHERVRNPLLTDIRVEWGGLPVSEVYPQRIPDLFGAKALVLSGRYQGRGAGTLRIFGTMAGKPWSRAIQVTLPDNESKHDVLASLWARRKIDGLLDDSRREASGDTREAVTRLGLDYRLMTPFTSFVAVEERIVNDNGKPRRIEVPVEMPDGVSYEGVFGNAGEMQAMAAPASAAGGSFFGAMRSMAAPRAMKSADAAPPRQLEARREATVPQAPASKLSPELERILQSPATARARFVRDGKAEIRVYLARTGPEALAELTRLGFELIAQPEPGIVVGRIGLGKLRAFAASAVVRLVTPLS